MTTDIDINRLDRSPAWGLPIRFHPARLSDEALDSLWSLARSELDRAPRFAGWLEDFCSAEYQRRTSILRSTIDPDFSPREATMPVLPCVRWSDRDIGEGLVVVHALTYSLRSEPAGRFVDLVCHCLVSLARRRLCKR